MTDQVIIFVCFVQLLGRPWSRIYLSECSSMSLFETDVLKIHDICLNCPPFCLTTFICMLLDALPFYDDY